MTDREISRRRFLDGVKTALQGAAGATLLGPRSLMAAPGTLADPKVVFSATHPDMVTGTSPDTVQYDWVRAGVDACVKAMTGTTSVGDAWETIFPGVTAASRVAIKINCLNTAVHPQLATVRALIEGMQMMLGGTFPAANISLFDNNLWNPGKVDACFGASTLDGLGIVHGEDTYNSGTTVTIGSTTTYVSKYWAEADYGVSLAKMSPHQYYAGGLSGVIKNMMGAVSTNNNANYNAKTGSSGFHEGDPYTAFRHLFTNYAADHLHLYVVDMLFACEHENESGWAKVPKRITMGRDPCAVDAYNADQINVLVADGMDVRKTVTKDVPLALEDAGVGSTQYSVTEPVVSLGPQIPTRNDLDRIIDNARQGGATDTEVQELIRQYREQ